MDNVRNKVLEKVKKGEVAMRPRWHFLLQTALMILGVIISALAVMYVASFVVFVLRYSGALYVPTFGAAGFVPFLIAVPWLLILLAILFVGVLQILVAKFSFVYHKPLLYSVLGVVLIAFLGSYFILQTSVHDRIQQRAEQGGASLLGPMYRQYGNAQPDDLVVGIVSAMTENNFVLTDRDGTQWSVEITKQTRIKDTSVLTEGATLFVFGSQAGDSITAQGIRPAPEDGIGKPRPGNRKLVPPARRTVNE